ncbi:MAG: Txe/YoeB family addiction module toxin [Pseudomonadota bacterium]|nr:Txe/YoeB family addiction module toxin [Pseudomonadota bacterium]
MARRGAPPQVAFSAEDWEDYVYWSATDRRMLERINALIAAILHDAFRGIGKPEPLKLALAGYWSRRIDQEHRLVYVFEDRRLTVIPCRYHY